MSTIKPKQGKCIDCDKVRYLTAGRCKFHYWKYRQSLKKPVKQAYPERRLLDAWFAERINEMPKYCENCGEFLNRNAIWGAKAYVAHILPKRDCMFPSVKLHPLNCMFFCIICHTNYDRWSGDKITKMKAFPLIVERFNIILPAIDDSELHKLPDYFENIISNAS